MSTELVPVRCDSCHLIYITGAVCHELGCLYVSKVAEEKREQSVEYVECCYCGGEVEAGEFCGCDERYEYYDDADEECE
jgi:Zn ribbon nucleic-acid-binding protein